MNEQPRIRTGVCLTCGGPAESPKRCAACAQDAGALVGEVVWKLVEEEVRRADDGQRIIHMLAGFQPAELAGIARSVPPHGLHGRSVILRVKRALARGTAIDEAHLTDEGPVHWRHSEEADVIVFAPADREREAIGASLGPIRQIDRSGLMDRVDLWMPFLKETGEADAFLRHALEGMRASGACIDLGMFVDFVRLLREQGYSRTVDRRLQWAAPALEIPVKGLVGLPAYKEGKPAPSAAAFRKVFRRAHQEVREYVYLQTARQERVDLETARENARTLAESADDEEVRRGVDAAVALIEDALDVRHGDWRPSQSVFCREAHWDTVGQHVFAVRRTPPKKRLGERTLEFIELDYRDELTEDDRKLLETLDNRKGGPTEAEQEFFERWRDRLNSERAEKFKIFREWHKRLFHKEIVADDLVTALAEGFEALMIAAGDDIDEMEEPGIIVSANHKDKGTFWRSLDRRVHALFRFELRCVQGLLTAPRVIYDLDNALKHEATAEQTSATKRRVELELYLVDCSKQAEGDRIAPKNAPRVKAVWEPGRSGKARPVSLALPEDLADLAVHAGKTDGRLFPSQSFTPRSHLSQRDKGAMTLADTTTFSDVAHGQNGRTVDHDAASSEDLLEEARRQVERLAASHSLTAGEAHALTEAMDAFRTEYAQAVSALVTDPGAAMAGDLLQRQADAFGALCRVARTQCTSTTSRSAIRSRVAGIGVVPASGGEDVAILAAWHPLRLAERRAKIAFLADFVYRVLSSSRGADLDVAYHEVRQLLRECRFPEAAFVNDETYVGVESVGGASLLVPARNLGHSAEALEQSARSAAQKFSEGVDEYLEVHPHEAANLSAAIYNSESASLPREFAHRLADKIRKDPGLRCDLLITHHNQKKMRAIYEQQNVLLAADNMAENTRGVLSRLRVGVVPSTSEHDPEGERDIDLVLLHEAVGRAAKPAWDLEPGGSLELDPAFDVRAGIKPRRRLAEADASGTGIYLTIARPPRSVADYHDLLYVIDKDGYIPEDKHAVLTRAVDFNDGEVQETIERAHKLGEWVLTFDQIASRQVFEAAGVKIIRDVTLPDSQSRVLISALSAGASLKRRLARGIERICDVDLAEAQRLTDAVLSRVIEVSGQKILGAARYENATVEMIGLYVARAIMESALPEGAEPIWISLDDNRRWFTTGSGKIADIVGVTILDRGDQGFLFKLQVGEAKCIGQAALASERKDSAQQVRDTAERLRETLVDNADPISRAAWCSRLASLLVMRDGLSQRIRNPARRAAFLDAMNRGDVAFELSGEAVLCVHDDDTADHYCVPDATHPHLRTHQVPRARIKSVLQASSSDRSHHRGLPEVHWLRGQDAPDSSETDEAGPPTPPAPTPIQTPGPMAAHPEGGGNATGSSHGGDARPTEGQTVEPGGAGMEANGRPPGPDEPHTFIPAPVQAVLEDMRSRESGSWEDDETIAWVERICTETQRALSQFGMQPEFAEPKYRLTPNGALISFRGHPTLTVDKIEKKRMELLTTYGLQVIDVRPGRGRISLFVAREKRMPVPLASTWLDADWPEGPATALTSFILGVREDNGSPLWLNFEGEFAGYTQHGPHTLIAGGTGSGKGVLTQSIILQIIAFNDPSQAELILIDPKKGVDFAWLKNASHLRRPLVTEIDASRAVFDELVALMDERYEVLERAGVPNISEFNASRQPQDRLSRVFVIHDEMGAWMAEHPDYSEAVVGAVSSLAMKGRAAGIHLTLITQRADVKAVPGGLRDNMGNRLCLKVANSTGSGMVLGHGGAEKLLGKGHLAAALDNEQPPVGQQHFVLQVPFAATPDIKRLAEAAIAHWSE